MRLTLEFGFVRGNQLMARDEEDDEEGVKCGNELCSCVVDEEEGFCSNKCRKASKSERPSFECKCDHDDCADDE